MSNDDEVAVAGLPRESELVLSDGKMYKLAPLDLYVLTKVEEHFGGWGAFAKAFDGEPVPHDPKKRYQAHSGVLELLYWLITQAIKNPRIKVPKYQKALATRQDVGALVSFRDTPRVHAHLSMLLIGEELMGEGDEEGPPNGETVMETTSQ